MSRITRYDRLSRSGCSSLLVITVAPPEGIVISFILVVIVAEYWRVGAGAGAGEEVEVGGDGRARSRGDEKGEG